VWYLSLPNDQLEQSPRTPVWPACLTGPDCDFAIHSVRDPDALVLSCVGPKRRQHLCSCNACSRISASASLGHTPSILVYKSWANMTQSSKLYFDYSFLLYYISYCYEFILIGKYIYYKSNHVKFTWQNNDGLVKDYKVWISFCVCVPYKWEWRGYQSAATCKCWTKRPMHHPL
jgi:hypothetical protein